MHLWSLSLCITKKENHCGERKLYVVGWCGVAMAPKSFPQGQFSKGRFSHRKCEKFVISQRLLSA